MSTAFQHVPVLLEETLQALAIREDGLYVDCTAGGGGHSSAIARRLGPAGRLIALDRDPAAVEAASASIASALSERPSAETPSVEVVHSAFSGLDTVLTKRGVEPGTVQGVLADLGVSSPQLDQAERGFSFSGDGPLDMRMDTTSGSTAADLVASLPEAELARLLWAEADERDSRRIARAIVRERQVGRIETTAQLADIVSRAKGGRRGARIHPATKTFQALRIATNDEKAELQVLLDAALRWLAPGGRLALITFHSGEDRPVKRWLAAQEAPCSCPTSSPVCTCGRLPLARRLGRKGVTATPAELDDNVRSRTARLRAAVKLPPPPPESPDDN